MIAKRCKGDSEERKDIHYITNYVKESGWNKQDPSTREMNILVEFEESGLNIYKTFEKERELIRKAVDKMWDDIRD